MASVFKELVNISEALANEKNMKKETIISLLEYSFERTMRKKIFGDEKAVVIDGEKVYPDSVNTKLTVTINRSTGEANAKIVKPDGTQKTIDVPTDRLTASSVKQRFMDALRISHKESIAKTFVEEGDYLMKGVIRSIKKGDIVIEVNNSYQSIEGIMPKEERTPGVDYKVGKTVEVFWQNHADWENYFDNGGSFGSNETETKFDRRLVFSDRSPEWLAAWITREIPEIQDGEIEIVKVARKAGVRSKVSLKALDNTDNAALIVRGPRGSRWKYISNHLGSEIVDFVNYKEDFVENLTSAFEGIALQKVAVDENTKLLELCIPEKDMPKAFGKGGVNINLVAELLGFKIKVYSPEVWDNREEAEMNWLFQLFTEGVKMDEDTAQAFIEEGFMSVEEIAWVDPKEIVAVGLGDIKSVSELQAHLRLWLNVKENRLAWTEWKNIGLSTSDILMLKEKGVKTVEDLADFATDELQEVVPEWNTEKAQGIIMNAREVAYFSEETEE